MKLSKVVKIIYYCMKCDDEETAISFLQSNIKHLYEKNHNVKDNDENNKEVDIKKAMMDYLNNEETVGAEKALFNSLDKDMTLVEKILDGNDNTETEWILDKETGKIKDGWYEIKTWQEMEEIAYSVNSSIIYFINTNYYEENSFIDESYTDYMEEDLNFKAKDRKIYIEDNEWKGYHFNPFMIKKPWNKKED